MGRRYSFLTNFHSRDFVGKIAVTETSLCPCGRAIIDGEIYEVQTEGETVEQGRGVKIVRVKGKKIIVKRV
ncbi:MAG: NfeD family protein [Treponema sp.]|jgi:membrane-bound serine protease (ClpP class)|nr:NfeD family protein [Treponema sp.]